MAYQWKNQLLRQPCTNMWCSINTLPNVSHEAMVTLPLFFSHERKYTAPINSIDHCACTFPPPSPDGPPADPRA